MYVDEKTVEKPKVSILQFIYIISTTVLTYITSYEKRKCHFSTLEFSFDFDKYITLRNYMWF